MPHPDSIAAALRAKKKKPDDVLGHIADDDDVIVGAANGEPKTIIDAIEEGAGRLRSVRIHQMLPMRERRYFRGEIPGGRTERERLPHGWKRP